MKKITLLFISILVFSSCSDFLDETNRNSITGDVLYSTPEGYETLINACYAYSRVWYAKADGYAFTEMGTDCYTGAGADCGRAPQMAFYSDDLQGDLTLMQYMWDALYSGLNACNTALARSSGAGLSTELQKKREGEAHFLRALYLHLIVETWGGVILYTEEIDKVVTTAERSSVEDFYTQIFDDLDQAITKLTGTPNKDSGRVTQLAAKAFKARMCLYRGQYTEAAKLAKEVIGTSGFGMYDTFTETFKMSNAKGQNNSEAIWWVNYSQDASLQAHFDEEKIVSPLMGERYDSHAHLISAMSYWMVSGCGVWVTPQTHTPWVQCMPTISFLHMFDENIDQRYDGTFRTTWYVNDIGNNYSAKFGENYTLPGGYKYDKPFVDGGMQLNDIAFETVKYAVTDEYRKSKNYMIFDRNDVYDAEGKTIGTRDYFISTYKFEDDTKATGWEYWSSRDAFVLRIAEMYLIVAEAELMDNHPDIAVEYMNTLREKRAKPGKEADMRITAYDLDIDFILDERARELAGEQHRFFDLKRTGKLIERVKKYNPNAAIKDHHVVRPIPQAELDAVTNKDEFKQNNGYN